MIYETVELIWRVNVCMHWKNPSFSIGSLRKIRVFNPKRFADLFFYLSFKNNQNKHFLGRVQGDSSCGPKGTGRKFLPPLKEIISGM